MKLKLEVDNGSDGQTYLYGSGASLTRDEVSAMLAAIDAGRLDALRHYAQHGTLPPEPPVWPKLRVERRTVQPGWWVYSPSNTHVATVLPVESKAGPLWACDLVSHLHTTNAPTPQAAVDAARAWLAERWGLST